MLHHLFEHLFGEKQGTDIYIQNGEIYYHEKNGGITYEKTMETDEYHALLRELIEEHPEINSSSLYDFTKYITIQGEERIVKGIVTRTGNGQLSLVFRIIFNRLYGVYAVPKNESVHFIDLQQELNRIQQTYQKPFVTTHVWSEEEKGFLFTDRPIEQAHANIWFAYILETKQKNN